MNRNRIALALLILAVQSVMVTADLPIHCLKNQVTGKWILKESKVLAENNFQPLSCGHQIPDNEQTSYKAMGGTLTEVSKEIEVSLDDDFVVRGKEGKGKWTLIYDEGWEINYNGVKYTHFFKYVKDADGQYKSSCSSTLVGWFNNIQKKSRGCSQAFKSDGDNSLSDNIQQAHVVQPKDSMFIFSQISSTMHKLDKVEQESKIKIHTQVNSSPKKQTMAKLKLQQAPQFIDLRRIDRFQKSQKHQVEYKKKQNESIYLKPHDNVFAQMAQPKGTNLNHYEIVRRLNTVSGKSWSAKVPSFLSTMTLEQMNSRAGIRQNKPTFEFDHKAGVFVQKSSSGLRGNKSGTDYAHFSREDVSHLPKEFNWENYLHPVRSQEDCGSCYALATSAMLSSRLWIKYGDSTQLSPQHSLSCNYYNQGCNGGYGFLVSKFYSEFEAVPESCHPYEAVDGTCNKCNVESLSNVYTVTDYEYIGGSYGKSTERLMMEEIKANGPIVVSFEPKLDFMYYNKGVYHSVDINSWIEKDEKPQWQKVDHSVLCYGWGEDEDGKYWLLQNSWGEQWGENGNFRVRRGTDESNIESMGERATIEKKARRSANTTMFASTYSAHQDKYYSAFLQTSKTTSNTHK